MVQGQACTWDSSSPCEPQYQQGPWALPIKPWSGGSAWWASYLIQQRVARLLSQKRSHCSPVYPEQTYLSWSQTLLSYLPTETGCESVFSSGAQSRTVIYTQGMRTGWGTEWTWLNQHADPMNFWYHWYKYSTENSVAKGQRSSMVETLLPLNGKMKLVPVNYLFLICFGKRLWREFGNLHSISESRPDFSWHQFGRVDFVYFCHVGSFSGVRTIWS